MNDWIKQIAEDIMVEQVLVGKLEAVKDYDEHGFYLGIGFREPILFVPKRKGTWTESRFRAAEAGRSREPVEIPGRVGVWRVTELFLSAALPLEWDGERWVEGRMSLAHRGQIPGGVPCVAVRVVPWEPEPRQEPERAPMDAAEVKPCRMSLSLPVDALTGPFPDYAKIMFDKIAKGIAADEKRREQEMLGRGDSTIGPTW